MEKIKTVVMTGLLLLCFGMEQACVKRFEADESENLNKLTASEDLYLKAIRTVERSEGVDHPQLIEILSELAELYKIQNRFAEAETCLKRALAISKKTHGSDGLGYASLTTKLAGLYMGQEYRWRALAIQPMVQCSAASVALRAFYMDYGSFSGIFVDPKGGQLMFRQADGREIQLGAVLPVQKNLTWSVEGSKNRAEITFISSGSDCPTRVCSGRMCLECEDYDCNQAFTFGDPGLGLDKNPAGIGCQPPLQ